MSPGERQGGLVFFATPLSYCMNCFFCRESADPDDPLTVCLCLETPTGSRVLERVALCDGCAEAGITRLRVLDDAELDDLCDQED